jgi:quinol monooxygenase YgiN
MLIGNRYKNKEAITAHQQNPVYVALQEKAKEDSSLLAAPIEIKVLQPVAGFESR